MQNMSSEQMMARIAELESEVERKVVKEKALTFKVGKQGGVSVYGLQRFPVTLYANQWGKLLESREALVSFIEENRDQLSMRN